MSDRAVRAVLALTILALSVFYVSTKSPRLGLDLRGGTQIVLETRGSVAVKADRESTGQTLEVLRRRVDALGVSEPAIAQSGERRIIVELPGVHDPRQAAAVLGRTAQLTFHPVLGTRIREAVAGLGGHTAKIRDELIGPSLGDELRRGGSTFLYNNGPVTSIADQNLLFRQTYTLQASFNGGPFQTRVANAPVAPSRVGPASMPNYAKLHSQAITSLPGGVTSGPSAVSRACISARVTAS